MNTIQKLFAQESNRIRFIPFLMSGFPNLDFSKRGIKILSDLGADIIEVGVPFSDPVADGPINQRASAQALLNEVNLKQTLTMMEELRDEGMRTPLILFSYFNPILHLGFDLFIQSCMRAQVNALLVVDLPVEEAGDLYARLKENNIGMIFLCSPTTEPSRLLHYQILKPDFLYYVSRLGVTGKQSSLSSTLEKEVKQVKELYKGPVCVGFGISSPEQIQDLACYADGVIVGSALVEKLEEAYLRKDILYFQSFVKKLLCSGRG